METVRNVTGADDRQRPVMVGDLMIGDVIEVGGWPERVESIQTVKQTPGLLVVRTDGSVLVRDQAHVVWVERGPQCRDHDADGCSHCYQDELAGR